MKGYEWYLAGSLEKVFPGKMPRVMGADDVICILKGETPAVQLVYRRQPGLTQPQPEAFVCRVTGFPGEARLRYVELVPSAFPCYENVDDNYLSKEPGLFPDLLKPVKEGRFTPVAGQYRALWIDFPDTADVPAGRYEVEIHISGQQSAYCGADAPDGEVLTFRLEVAGESLPKQKLIHTEWFHADCVADYYHVPVFGDFHWKALESQIRLAAKLGINMLLAPVFTPPLDTEIGGERTTVQLVDITLEDGVYSFDFTLLERWCGLCRQAGIEYIEIPHLFTQWGAKATPKIVVREGGEEKKMFGWHVPSDSPLYRHFLEAFLPALQEELAALGYEKDHIYFHISDEPVPENQASYEKARNAAADLLEGYPVVDALSDFSFYEKGLVERPIVANNHIQPFADRNIPDLWVYYCCGQGDEVPNRFFAMPSARNRIMGVLMYLYRTQGFLQWGYNFYNTALSREHLDPYFDTHGGYAFPSGDTFLVYPGPGGETFSSIRGQVQLEGAADLSALCLLEEKIGRERVLELIYEGWEGEMTFRRYPADPSYLPLLRQRMARVFGSLNG